MPRRTRILWIACPSIVAGVVWLMWFSRILWILWHVGIPPIGGDFQTYYAAGRMMRMGQSAALYDEGTTKQIGSYIRPPFYAWVFVPFTLLPFIPAAILWMLLNLGCIWLSMRLLAPGRPLAFFWALTFMPVWAEINYVQSEGLSLLILCLVYLQWKQERLWSAGLVSGILTYKYPLLIGVVLLWLFRWRRDWRALVGLTLAGLALAGLSLVLMPEASLAYVRSLARIGSLIHQRWFRLVQFYSMRGFWLMLLPGHSALADVLYAVCAVTAVLSFRRFLPKHYADKKLMFGGAVCLTLLVTPYAFVYDWTVLLLPAALLWQQQIRGWREAFAIVWLATFLSIALTFIQLSVLSFAVQISVPALAIAMILLYTKLNREEICRR